MRTLSKDGRKGSISVFVLMLIAFVSCAIFAQMLCNMSVFGVSQSFYGLREQSLKMKSIKQQMDAAVFDACDAGGISAITESYLKKTIWEPGVALAIESNTLTDSLRGWAQHQAQSFRLSSCLNEGPSAYCGTLITQLKINDVDYRTKTQVYGVPLTNFPVIVYGPFEGTISKGGIYQLKSGSEKAYLTTKESPVSYDFRNEWSLFSDPYHKLWDEDLMSKRAFQGDQSFLISFPLMEAINEPGIHVSGNTLTLDLGTFKKDTLTLVDPLGDFTVRVEETQSRDEPLTLILYNNGERKQTTLTVLSDIQTSLVLFAKHTKIKVKDYVKCCGAWFLDPKTHVEGHFQLEGHLSCFDRSICNLLDISSSGKLKNRLLECSPYAFVVETEVERL